MTIRANRCILLVMTVALLWPLTGCWDRRELNELAISVALGIDKVDDKYQVTVQVVQPAEVASQKGGAGNYAPVVMYQTTGITIFEAIRKMTITSPRKIYASHLRIVVIGEQLAREGIGNALDLLSRDYELRTDFFLLVAKGIKAEKVLKILVPLEKIPANKIYNSIRTSEKVWAPVTAVTLDDFIMDYESKGKNPVINGIRVTGNAEIGIKKENVEMIQPAARIKNSGIAVFRKDQMIGWLTEDQSKGYNYVINTIKSTVGHIQCPDGGYVALEVVRSKSKMKAAVQNGNLRLAVDIHVEENLGEVQCQLDLTKVSVIQELERKAELRVKDLVEQTMDSAQKKFRCDFFGFGNALHRSNPKAWKKLQPDWDEHFAEAPVSVTVKVNIKRTGTIGNSFMLDREE
ncbi:Ger(x)C family spore germination protein [Paenibacillus kobensis]|uniref:Ger(x)C family spore germination protein n=1 Tax=Paenibacillus kobensis TaxID=59841 RepID=UPI000FDA66FF|nr:Ger(x)C family spore germination protein [Paenibacillus kobensis]